MVVVMYFQNSKIKRKNFSSIVIVFLLLLLFLASCGKIESMPGVTPHTPTVTPTATCPHVQLSTPDGWKTSTRLTVILFSRDAVGNQFFEMENGDRETEVATFVKKIIPNLLGPSDHIAVFHLGFDKYEDARISNLGSYINIPQFYNTPAPYNTVTPIPSPEKTPEAGMLRVQATNEARDYQTQVAQINTENEATYICQMALWNATAAADAASWEVTKVAENTKIENETIQGFDEFSTEDINKTDATKNGDLYYGLSFATTILDARCKEYDECFVIIIDDLSHSYSFQKLVDIHQNPELDMPDFVYPDLHGAKIYTIIPNCEDIDMPACQDLQKFWLAEFDKFGANPDVTFWNGKRIEARLLQEYQENRR